MANLVQDGGFELGYWTLSDASYGSYETSPVRSGSKSLRLRIESGGLGGYSFSGAQSRTIAIHDAGTSKEVEIYVRSDTNNSAWKIQLEHYALGVGGAVFLIDSVNADVCFNSWTKLSGTVTPTSTSDAVYLLPGKTGVPFGGCNFYLDDCIYAGDSLSVKLAERAVDAIVSLLQSDLGTELTAIDTDRADGVTMADPPNANYYKRPKPEIAGGAAHIEVFESELEFDNPYTDSGDGRAVYDIPITIRVTWFNRDGDTRDTMVTRGRRYAAGVFNAISKTPGLGDSDDATQIAAVNRCSPAWVDGDKSAPNRMKGQITLECSVSCEEVQS